MSNPSPESYGWVADDEYTWFAVAGCVTVVAGSGPEGALTAIGADLEQSARLEDVVDADGLSWVSASRLESPAPGEASVLLEDNGREGSRPEVLIRLSKAGKAAAVYWNVKGLVIFACARRGKVLAQIEMPEVDDVDGVPRNLLRLLREADRHPDTVAVAMAMAEKFTGIPVPPTPAVRRPATAHPITEPVLGLRVTTDELLVLGYPTPELVAAVQTATPAARRRLAEWSATHAVEKAELTNERGVIAMLDQFGQGRPTRQSAQTAALRRLAQRGAAAADTALIVDGDGDPARRHMIRHSYDMYWAMEALSYTAAGDAQFTLMPMSEQIIPAHDDVLLLCRPSVRTIEFSTLGEHLGSNRITVEGPGNARVRRKMDEPPRSALASPRCSEQSVAARVAVGGSRARQSPPPKRAPGTACPAGRFAAMSLRTRERWRFA